MKKFTFSLDRVLAWRRLQLDQERAALEKLLFDHNALVQREQFVRTKRRTYEEGLARSLHFDAREVVTLPQWQSQVLKSLSALASEQQQMKPRIAQQQEKIREAERKVKLLERLRERRHDAWKIELGKEEEAFAAEAYLARCIRLRRVNPAGA